MLAPPVWTVLSFSLSTVLVSPIVLQVFLDACFKAQRGIKSSYHGIHLYTQTSLLRFDRGAAFKTSEDGIIPKWLPTGISSIYLTPGLRALVVRLSVCLSLYLTS